MRRPKRDYYEVLGVPETADGEQISRAFRRMARDLHPDVSDSPAAEERFREVSAAYSALSKPRSRFLYDRFGFRGRGAGFEDGHFPGAPSVLGEVELEQYEAARGVRREVQIVDADLCRTCDGSGAAPGTEVRTCERCMGKGTLRVSSGLGVGRWLKVEPCPEAKRTELPLAEAKLASVGLPAFRRMAQGRPHLVYEERSPAHSAR